MASLFVHWIERFAISYLGLWLIILVFTSWGWDMDDKYYFGSQPGVHIVICIIMFLLISFSTTPVDWLIHKVTNEKAKIPHLIKQTNASCSREKLVFV